MICRITRDIVGISIRYDDNDPLTLLKVVGVLGYCPRRVEESDIGGSENSIWFSLHDVDGSVIDSPF